MKFNVSRLKMMQTCPMKAWLTYCTDILGSKGIIQGKEMKPPAEFGTAVHKAIEAVTRGMQVDEAVKVGKDHLRERAEAAKLAGQHWAAERLLFGTGGSPYQCKVCTSGRLQCGRCKGRGHSAKTKKPCGACNSQGTRECGTCGGAGTFAPKTSEGLDHLARCVRGWVEANPPDGRDIILAEAELELDLGNGHQLIGRLDRVDRWAGGFWDHDYKTAYRGSDQATEIARYEMDLQRIVYWQLLTQWLNTNGYDGPVLGSQLDVIVKTYDPQYWTLTIGRRPEVEGFLMEQVRRATEQWAKLDDIQTRGSLPVEVPMYTTNCKQFQRTCSKLTICNGTAAFTPEALPIFGYEPRPLDYADENYELD